MDYTGRWEKEPETAVWLLRALDCFLLIAFFLNLECVFKPLSNIYKSAFAYVASSKLVLGTWYRISVSVI